MSETKRATWKKNSNRVKASERGLYSSTQKSYYHPKKKVELTIPLWE